MIVECYIGCLDHTWYTEEVTVRSSSLYTIDLERLALKKLDQELIRESIPVAFTGVYNIREE